MSDNRGIIENCINNIEVKNTKYGATAGGIAGDNNGIIKKCFNQGNISGGISGGIAGLNGTKTITGGIMGQVGYIYNCYNLANVTGNQQGGIAGIIGFEGANGYIYNSYKLQAQYIGGQWKVDSASHCLNSYGTDANTKLNELNNGIDEVGETESTEEPWIIVEGVNNGYPILKWQIDNTNIVPIYTAGELIKVANAQSFENNGKVYVYNSSKTCVLEKDIILDEENAGVLTLLRNNNININENGKNIKVINGTTASVYSKSNNFQTAVQTMELMPNEYQKVEYIQSSGTQYVNTQYIPNEKTKIETEFSFVQIAISMLYGERTSGTNVNGFSFVYNTSGNGARFDFNGNSSGYMTFNTGIKYKIKQDKNKYYLNGEYKGEFAYTFLRTTLNEYIFCGNTAGRAEDFTYAKIYYFKIYDNDSIIRYFIPCYLKSDTTKAGGLYDIVNGQFYANAGTGTFAVGADV